MTSPATVGPHTGCLCAVVKVTGKLERDPKCNDPHNTLVESWEFREDPDGSLDEVVLRDVQLVHVEMLSDSSAYLQFHFADGSWGQVEIRARKRRLTLTASQEPTAQEGT